MVNETVLEVPGYSVLALVPWIVSAELAPTVAVPVPEPLVVKYATAPLARSKSNNPLSASERFLVKRRNM
jgi:hypothetical protein